MRRYILLVLIIGALPSSLFGQDVPEGVHQATSRPSEMCGLFGRDAIDFIEKAKTSPTLKWMQIGSDRFDLFQDATATYSLLVTKPSEPAYPAASCRHVFEENGGIQIGRQMKCNADRKACDALFFELQALDTAAAQEIRKLAK